VNRHKLTVAKRLFDRKPLGLELHMILDHCPLQRRKALGKIWIVVPPLHIHKYLICFINTSCYDELQELHSHLFDPRCVTAGMWFAGQFSSCISHEPLQSFNPNLLCVRHHFLAPGYERYAGGRAAAHNHGGVVLRATLKTRL
jgi:hypothetical protein